MHFSEFKPEGPFPGPADTMSREYCEAYALTLGVKFNDAALASITHDESVEHPHHYGGDTTYEAIKVIEAWDLNFSLGSAIKYICRLELKEDPIENLKKARKYLDFEIARREALKAALPAWVTKHTPDELAAKIGLAIANAIDGGLEPERVAELASLSVRLNAIRLKDRSNA